MALVIFRYRFESLFIFERRIDMANYLKVAQVVVSVLLIGSILLQARGAGLGGLLGGEGNVYSTKRGAEKILFVSTIILSAAFLGLALLSVLIAS